MIKIKPIFALSFLIWCTNLNAQISKKYTVSLDTYLERSNLYFLKFSGVKKPNLLYQTNYSVQAKISYYIKKDIALTSGLGYTTRGFNTENKVFNVAYLQIPVQVKYDILDYRYFQLSSHLGGYVGLPISNSQKLQGVEFDWKEDNIDLGIEYGVTGLFPINDHLKFTATFRSQIGVTNVYDYNNYENKGNISYSFGVGIIKYFNKF
ncbi:MAG: outer membrane beta-barrel protein [Flavobacterium sp.]|jgi:hypothetical protein